MEKCLSIFIDESGDFGEFDSNCPFYLVTMLFHNQSDSITDELMVLEQHLSARGYNDYCLHTGPLIRREEVYSFFNIDERKQILNSFINFATKINFFYKSFIVEKKKEYDQFKLIALLSKQIKTFLQQHLVFFSSFDKIIVYYDNGQKQLTSIVATLFSESNVEFRRKVIPAKYRLLQVADMLTTFELIELKRERGSNSSSEQQFFVSMRDFYKNYYKRIMKKKL